MTREGREDEKEGPPELSDEEVADVEVFTSVRADELRFESVPETKVSFEGEPAEQLELQDRTGEPARRGGGRRHLPQHRGSLQARSQSTERPDRDVVNTRAATEAIWARLNGEPVSSPGGGDGRHSRGRNRCRRLPIAPRVVWLKEKFSVSLLARGVPGLWRERQQETLDWRNMPDVADVTSNALQVVSKAKPSAGQLKNPKGIATAGAALIALPYAAQGLAKLKGGGGDGKTADLGKRVKEKVADKAKDVAGDVADEKLKPNMPSGLGGLLKKIGSSSSGGGSDDEDSGDQGDVSAHGSGRRMPMQQSVDVAVPVKVAYNLWTRFEDWPEFMHRVDSADQVDDATVEISTKVWGITRRFEAEIVEQRPDERIEWNVEEGLSHSGVVTFHQLAPRLTRIEVSLDVEPEGLLEKAGRGMRFAKRAVRGDLHRFKAYAEVAEEAEEGGWRGTIEDGDVKRKTERKSSRSGSAEDPDPAIDTARTAQTRAPAPPVGPAPTAD